MSILNIKREIVPVRVGFINLPHTFIEDHYGNYFEEWNSCINLSALNGWRSLKNFSQKLLINLIYCQRKASSVMCFSRQWSILFESFLYCSMVIRQNSHFKIYSEFFVLSFSGYKHYFVLTKLWKSSWRLNLKFWCIVGNYHLIVWGAV